MAELKGTFYGVSVGPGDPELLTLQAVRLIRKCPVLHGISFVINMQVLKKIKTIPILT